MQNPSNQTNQSVNKRLGLTRQTTVTNAASSTGKLNAEELKLASEKAGGYAQLVEILDHVEKSGGRDVVLDAVKQFQTLSEIFKHKTA